ncbi:MAG: phosphocholine cytidylyltransferase family protein [Myxococcales bacterium]|nr:MAG: phosphocholine cytidylyltransferase family protein [Myxococcales bacterium]
MQALLLAAGVGKRLGPYTKAMPKCLLEVAGQTLLERHLANYANLGFSKAVIVTGHEEDKIKDAVASLDLALRIELIRNDEYTKGSILSLRKGLDAITEDVVTMDADVFYHPQVLATLAKSSHANSVLIDERSDETGEEMMIGIRANRAAAIARRVSPIGPFDKVGESIGFFRIAKADQSLLKQTIDRTIKEQGEDLEYETALNAFFDVAEVKFETVGNLPWTEIDFEQDLARARNEIAPAILSEG